MPRRGSVSACGRTSQYIPENDFLQKILKNTNSLQFFKKNNAIREPYAFISNENI